MKNLLLLKTPKLLSVLYNIKYSYRKTISIRVNRDLTVTVHAPFGVSRRYIDEFILKNAVRIESIKNRIASKNAKQSALSDTDIDNLRCKAKEYIPQRADYFANKMGVKYTGIKITSAKTRFGSCSAKNSLCFSLYLMTYPKQAIDYVIVHELSHIVEKNHSPRFYKVVESIMPDYKHRIDLLKNGVL